MDFNALAGIVSEVAYEMQRELDWGDKSAIADASGDVETSTETPATHGAGDTSPEENGGYDSFHPPIVPRRARGWERKGTAAGQRTLFTERFTYQFSGFAGWKPNVQMYANIDRS